MRVDWYNSIVIRNGDYKQNAYLQSKEYQLSRSLKKN